MAMNDIAVLDMDATTMAEAIAAKQITSFAATEIFISHLQKFNPYVNCLVEERFTKAREEAQRADEALAQGKAKGRLFGVPISIKESFDVAEMRTTGGIPRRKDIMANKDADIVARLRKEGAIILGKTNTPVLCFCQESDNKLYGRTNNPWNLSQTAGGSSGGEAASIAAGGAAVGVGSDIGGSIRFPSHFNGVIGFKSGNQQVSQRGSFPSIEHPLQKRMLGMGALAKSVRDARMINEIIANNQPKTLSLDDFSLVIPMDTLQYPAKPSTLTALKSVAKVLGSYLPVVDEQPPYYNQATSLWQLSMALDGAKAIGQLANGGSPLHPLREYLKERLFHKSDLHHYFTWVIAVANMVKPGKKQLSEMQKTLQQGDRELKKYFNQRLLILPVYHCAAPVHGQVIKELFSLRLTFRRYLPFVAYANTWGLPALVIPVAEDDNGLPIGVQIISRVGNEDAIFKLGEILERELRGYRRSNVEKNLV
jgi:fatty acid amide hydrolase 2